MKRYPPAKWLGNGPNGGQGYGAYTMDVPARLAMHTTETSGMPGYAGGVHPHLTFDPRNLEWTQHIELDRICGVLVGSVTAGGPTNAARAVGVEMICYSQESVVDKYPNTGRTKVSELSDEALRSIAAFWSWCHTELGVKLEWRQKPFNDSRCSGVGSPCRMTWDEWLRFDAICDHAQVPGNSHWDAGPFDWHTTLGYAVRIDKPDPDEEVTMITTLQELLTAQGYGPLKITGEMNAPTRQAWARMMADARRGAALPNHRHTNQIARLTGPVHKPEVP